MGETVTPAETGTGAAGTSPAVGTTPAASASPSGMFEDEILMLVKCRLNRRAEDTSLDEYLRARIAAVQEELGDTGIRLQATPRDMMFVADYTAWQYANRDKQEPMPDWLRLARRERWLQQQRENAGGAV